MRVERIRLPGTKTVATADRRSGAMIPLSPYAALIFGVDEEGVVSGDERCQACRKQAEDLATEKFGTAPPDGWVWRGSRVRLQELDDHLTLRCPSRLRSALELRASRQGIDPTLCAREILAADLATELGEVAGG